MTARRKTQPERMAGFVLVIAKRHIAHRIAARVKSRRTECAIDDTGIQLVGRGVSPEKMASASGSQYQTIE
jgi:hypothetical protein